MIRELHLSTFVREKVSFLTRLARETGTLLTEFAPGGFPDEGPEEIDNRDAELLSSMETMTIDQALWDPPSERWLPRSAYAGILQSTLDRFYRRNESVVEDDEDNIFGEGLNDDPLIPANLMIPANLPRGAGRLQLNQRDPHWALVLQAKAIKLLHGVAAFPDNSTRPSTPLHSEARMILVGDWGSGIPKARRLSDEMWNSHLQPYLGSRELHVVYLGDVYYAGLPSEYQRNFLPHWPVPNGSENDVGSWCLAGNHDMYSGGHGFFDMLKDPRFARQNQSSYFLMQSDHWQVFGLDTSFDPRDFSGDIGELYGEQAAWVAQKRAAAPEKRCLILTHHQPFSAYDNIAENLERRLRPIRRLGQIDVWFWGHEHLCAVYESCDGINYPVLLGHGGFPERPKQRLPGTPQISYEWQIVDNAGFLRFGFAVLDFDAERIAVQLVDEDGSLRHGFIIP